MRNFNLKHLVYCVYTGLRVHACSTSMARVLSTIHQSRVTVFLKLITEGRTHWDDPGQGQEAQWEKKKPQRKLEHVIILEEMKF